MVNRKEGNAAVKKVQPYPIAVKVAGAEQTNDGKIVRLAERGFILDTHRVVYKTGTRWQVEFEVPVLHYRVMVECKVIKTYDRFGGPNGTERMAEFHFINLTDEQRKVIREFLVKINQVIRTL